MFGGRTILCCVYRMFHVEQWQIVNLFWHPHSINAAVALVFTFSLAAIRGLKDLLQRKYDSGDHSVGKYEYFSELYLSSSTSNSE